MDPIYYNEEEEEEQLQEEHISIEIDPPKIASNLKSKLVESSPLTDLCCIFEVPRKLRKNKERLFRPSLVSIGPYHHSRSQRLQPMEDIKMWYLNCLLARSPTPDNLLELLVRSVGAHVNLCRKCYAEKQKLPRRDEALVEMMVVDGCFIIEYFRKHNNVVPKSEDDPIFEMSWMRKTLVVDFLLLENQVPWWVLNLLYKKTQVAVESQRKNLSLAQLSHNSMYSYAFRESPIRNLDISRLQPIRHLLDLHRSIILYFNQNKQVLPAGANAKKKNNNIKGLVRNTSLELGHMKKSSQHPSSSVPTRDDITIVNLSQGPVRESVPIVSSEGNGLPMRPSSPPPPPPPPPPSKPVPLATNLKPKGNQEQKKLATAKFSLPDLALALSSTGPLDYERSDSEKHPQGSSGKHKRFVYTPCIKVLLQAGVSFQVQEGDDLMDIRFENGVLKIPRLHLMDNAEILLRNLIAYEQFDGDLEGKITSYACFLDNLIDSSSDIETLRDANIVSSHLSPEDVSGFFNGLYNNVHVVHYAYWDVAKNIQKYCKYTIPKWRVIFWRDYFSNPWSGISVIAAIIILALTFVQTYYAVTNN